MKKIKLTIYTLLLTVTVFSQTVIKNPQSGCSTAQILKIKQITLSDSTTVIDFHLKDQPGMWIYIPKDTYIQSVGSDEKIFTSGTKGIPFRERYWIPESGEADFSVVFPKINPGTKKIDYGEANPGGTWFIYDIQLKPEESIIPETIRGNWFNQKSGILEVSFQDTIAIYQSKLWHYGKVDFIKNGFIELIDKKEKLVLFVKKDIQENLTLDNPYVGKIYCTRNPVTQETIINEPNEAFVAPIFKIDTAFYSGYIKGYSPRIGIKTFTIISNDIITGEQKSVLIEIQNDGSFSAKVPIYYPQQVYVNSQIARGTAFLEPGKSLFQIIDPMQENTRFLYMGESATINIELHNLKTFCSFDYKEAQKLILDMSPKQLADYCKSLWKKDLTTLDSLLKDGRISKKAFQMSKYNLDFMYATNILSYKWIFMGAYRQKNNIPQSQRYLPIKVESPSPDYLDFITPEFINDPLAVLSSQYGAFINNLKYAEFLRPENQINLNTKALIDLGKSSLALTNDEKETIAVISKLDSIMELPEIKSYNQKYAMQEFVFFEKYNDVYNELKKSMKDTPVSISLLGEKLQERGDSLSTEELELISASKIVENTPEMKIHRKLQEENKESISAINKKYNEEIKASINKKMEKYRLDKLNEYFGIREGLAIDLFTSQDACRKIVAEMTPLSPDDLATIKRKLTNSFIADYITLCNNQTKQKLEASKSKTGFIVNDTPKVPGDQLFDKIISKYKGKVVYVDFWATWCSPCRSGIEEIKPLKEELAGENVSFVYITNQTSPKNTWTNLISDIKGEHYRVSDDEWNYLSSKFNITGIPHYTLVNKAGTVVNPHLGHMNNNALKDLLRKYIKE